VSPFLLLVYKLFTKLSFWGKGLVGWFVKVEMNTDL